MRKACGGSGSAALLVFVAAASVASQAQGSPWYLVVLWVGCAIFSAAFVVLLIASGVQATYRYTHAIQFVDIDWRCHFWERQGGMKVTVWFHDRSGASQYRANCRAQVGQTVVNLDEVTLGGSYFNKAGITQGGGDMPIMAEFVNRDVKLGEIGDVTHATIALSLQPMGFKGCRTTKVKRIPLQVVNG